MTDDVTHSLRLTIARLEEELVWAKRKNDALLEQNKDIVNYYKQVISAWQIDEQGYKL